MRILFLTSSMQAGGAERVASTLVNAWARRGDQVTLMPTFSGGGTCFYPLSADVRLVYLASLVTGQTIAFPLKLDRLCALRRFMAAERPDVIVSFLSNVNVAAIAASIGLRIPLVVCERIDPFAMPDLGWWQRLACRLAYPLADVLMVQTEAVAERYRSKHRYLPAVRVIPNPLADEMLKVERARRTGNEMHLVGMGRLVQQKRFDRLINCFSTLAHQYDQWTLKIVGEGPLRATLQQQIDTLGMGNRIALIGQVQDVGAVLAQADGFVLTSDFEGFPNALLEAMAVGLPCACFDCPSGPREMSLNGEVALLVPPNDEPGLVRAMSRIMGDAQLRLTLGRRARAAAMDRYSLDAVLAQWDALFDEMRVGSRAA